jgi:ornithine carbamoyltransferase
MVRHFIELADIDTAELRSIIAHAHQLKAARSNHEKLLTGKNLAMIFEKHSTRTRISFEVAMWELGGHPIILSANDLQLGRGETIADTARVLSRYNHAIMMRATLHEKLVELQHAASIPIINGLTDMSHPCQIMADIMTIEERLGTCKGKKIAWFGDGNNVLHSFVSAAAAFEYESS